jgi:hemolysin III
VVDDIPQKPLLRGVLHQAAAFAAAGAGAVLVATAPTSRGAWACFGFATSLVALFTVSAVYHRVNWSPVARARMRRADHATIFVLIAGTYTPIALVGLPPELGNQLLLLAWGGALVGIVQSLFWTSAPKPLTAVLAVVVGWSVGPYLKETGEVFNDTEMILAVGGGVVYTLGAVFYALKRPAFWPRVFGYHEAFHACTLVAAVLHFALVLSIVQRAAP